MLENLRLTPALVLFFSFSFFHSCFFLCCRKVSRTEVGEEAQKILIFVLQKEELHFKNLMLRLSPSPQCPGHLIVWPHLFPCISKGAEGWEGVGLSALHGEHWGASLPGRESPLSGWVDVDHQHSDVSWVMRPQDLPNLQSFIQQYSKEGRFWQCRHCPWLVPREAGEHLQKIELHPASK